jgi:hypothetical protein
MVCLFQWPHCLLLRNATGAGNSPFWLYCSFNEARASPPFAFKTMHRTVEGHRESSYLAKLEADRQAQHSGYGVRRFHAAGGIIQWEAYGWERITELQSQETSYGLFEHKWQAEQYFNNIING